MDNKKALTQQTMDEKIKRCEDAIKKELYRDKRVKYIWEIKLVYMPKKDAYDIEYNFDTNVAYAHDDAIRYALKHVKFEDYDLRLLIN